MLTRWYDIDGCRVIANLESPWLALVVDSLLAPYLAESSSQIDIKVTIGAGRLPKRRRAAAQFVFRPLEIHVDGVNWELRDNVGWLRLDAEAGTIEGFVKPDARPPQLSRFAGLTVFGALLECLRARGRYPLHAAALVSPSGQTALFPGRRRSGKSTVALSLYEQGWTVLSDDTIFALRTPPHLLGHARQFHVRADLLERRPDLAAIAQPLEWYEPAGKYRLGLTERVVRRAPLPSCIYFTQIVDEPISSVTALPAQKVLLGLLEHSALVFVDPRRAAPHLDVLRELSDGAQGFALRCGRDLLAQPSLYATLIQSSAREQAA